MDIAKGGKVKLIENGKWCIPSASAMISVEFTTPDPPKAVSSLHKISFQGPSTGTPKR